MQTLTVPLRIHRRSGADRRRRLAGAPIRHQPPRRQHQSRTDAAAGRDRRRRRGWPPAAGAGPARQCRTSADDRRPDRHRGGTQYRARDARRAIRCRRGLRSAASSRPGSPRCPMPAWSDGEAARSDASADIFDHGEPQMPEPPPRPARPSFADEVRRPAAPPMPERRSDPLAGFAPEPLGGRQESRPESRPNRGPIRSSPRLDPRPSP